MPEKIQSDAQQDSSPSRFKRFAARRPKLVLLLVNVVGISFLLFVVEAVLRAKGIAPGYLDMGYDDFRPLPAGEPLKVSLEFYTDSLCIFRARPDSFNHRPPGYYVNSWGFRCPEMESLIKQWSPIEEVHANAQVQLAPQDSSRKKVMLIGDSFTWGATARPLDSSYADRLRRPGRQVFNFGIPGADPDQYERIAKQYIPIVNPDVVCLFFYMGNDVMYMPGNVVPNGNRYHITNIGWLNAYLDGSYMGGPQETYQYYLDRFNVPPNNWFNRFCAQTVIGTRLWQVLDRLKWVDDRRLPYVQQSKEAGEKLLEDGPYAGVHLLEVDRFCKERNIPFHLFVIPGHNAVVIPDTAANPRLFRGLPFHYPSGLTEEDYYGRPDGHFNNIGHRKMAKFVEMTIGN